MAVFIVVGTLGPGIPVAIYFLMGQRATAAARRAEGLDGREQRGDHGRAAARDRRQARRRRISGLRRDSPSRRCAATSASWLRGDLDRRAHGVGGAGPRGARLRVDRRRLARRRPLRGAAGAAPVRRLRQLAPPRRRADVGDRRAVGGDRRRPSRRATRRLRRAHRRAGRSPRASLALVAGLLRLGFLASFISEPVLKGFIVGLALTIIIGQVPKLFGVDKGERRLLRAARGASSRNLGDTDGAHAARRRGCRWPSCSGCGGGARRARARWSPSCSASPRSTLFDLDDHGVDIVGTIDSRACPRSASPTSAAATTSTLAAGGGRRHAGRLRRGARRGQDLRGPRPLRDRRQPRAARPRRRQPRRRPVERHGRQRQPVQDRGQRRRPAPARSSRASSSPCSRS